MDTVMFMVFLMAPLWCALGFVLVSTWRTVLELAADHSELGRYRALWRSGVLSKNTAKGAGWIL
jgi:hypothetical protein